MNELSFNAALFTQVPSCGYEIIQYARIDYGTGAYKPLPDFIKFRP
jgi:hypothetical protein